MCVCIPQADLLFVWGSNDAWSILSKVWGFNHENSGLHLCGECGCFNPLNTSLPRVYHGNCQPCRNANLPRIFWVLHKNQQKFKSNVHYKEPFNCYLFLIHYHIIIIVTTTTNTIIVMSLANGVSPNGSLPISSTLLGLILLMKHLDDTISVHTTHISRSSSVADLSNIRHVSQFPTTRSMTKTVFLYCLPTVSYNVLYSLHFQTIVFICFGCARFSQYSPKKPYASWYISNVLTRIPRFTALR